MIIIANDPNKLAEPNFKDFIIYDNGETDVRVMSVERAYLYALYFIGDKWAEAEGAEAEGFIKQYSMWEYQHRKNSMDKWVEAADVIMKYPERAFYYAFGVIRCRWAQAEEFVKQSPKWACDLRIVGGRWANNFTMLLRRPLRARNTTQVWLPNTRLKMKGK